MASRPFVVPVRFSVGPHVVQATTLALSTECAFVRCLVPPRPGDNLSIELYLPGGPPLQIAAKVRERTVRDAATGFWADFARDILKLARISRALAAVPEEGGSERRATARYPVHLAVRFGTLDQLRKEFATNISAGGMFIRTDRPPPMDAVVQVSIDLPGGGAPIEAKATVVHRVTAEQARERGVEAGAGVQFVQTDDRFRERLDQMIETAAARGK